MKKLLLALLCCASLIRPAASADLDDLEALEQDNIDDIAKDIGIVRFTITLYKDRDTHDAAEWQTIITKAAQTMYRLQGEYADRTDILKELNEIVDALQNNQVDNGIAGELTVEASDGKPSKDCCGKNCKCSQMYRGNCPCSLNNAAANRCVPIPDEDDVLEMSETPDASGKDSFEEVDLNEVDLNEEVTTKCKSCCK